jgi:hypothetical protein
MPQREPLNPVQLLLRGPSSGVLIQFFRALAEEIDAAFSNATVIIPIDERGRPAVQARGSTRRWQLDVAVRRAAERAGLEATTGYTDPPSWSFPLLHLGAFSVTLGVVDRKRDGRVLRAKGKYVQQMVARNRPLDPQLPLFDEPGTKVPRLIPSGTFGAMIVVEYSATQPDAPIYAGFYIPSHDLTQAYYSYSLFDLMVELRDADAAVKKPARRTVARKRIVLKQSPKKKDKD